MSEQQPDVRWAPIPPKPRSRGRVWLIVGLSLLALVIVGALLFFLLPRGESPDPVASASPTSTPTPIVTPPITAEPTTPVETEPPVVDPSLPEFRGRVGGWLDSALTGLDIIANGTTDVSGVIDTLQDDAQRLSEAARPASIDADWSAGVAAYSGRLTDLRSATASGSGVDAALDAARAAVDNLRSIAGL